MARCPFAIWRPLPENATQGRITPRAVILHTAVDSATENSSIYPYFGRADVGVECHFYVFDNGLIEQYIDTEVRADANAEANAFAVSIETEDDGNPMQNAWTPDQLHSIVKLVDWLCNTHNIPRKKIQRWDSSGIGWHAMWGAPSQWTPAKGKTCPGPIRIAQINNVILPKLVAGGEEFDMTPAELTKAFVDALREWNYYRYPDGRNLIDDIKQQTATQLDTNKKLDKVIELLEHQKAA